MVRKQKSIFVIGFALLCVAAVLAGGLIANSDSSRWTSHADLSWFEDNDLAQSYTIDTPEKLAGIALLVNKGVTDDGIEINGFAGKVFDIDRNLDLSAYLWEPIGTPENPFRGTMYSKDGAAFTISGMKLAPETEYAGLVGVMDGGTFGGFVFANSGSFSLHNSWQTLYAGVAVGKMINNSTVYNITNYLPIQAGSINAAVYAGGIVGYSSGDADISNSVNHANLTINGSSVYTGGIVGYTEGTELVIKKVTNNGAITANGFDEKGDIYTGGIAGLSSGPLFMHEDATPIHNTGAIAATGGRHSYAGGIVAKVASDVTFSAMTLNSGQVSVNAPQAIGSYSGGLAGSIAWQQVNPLNQVNFTSSGSIINNGGSGVYTGGIAGYMDGAFQWSNDFTNEVSIQASGSSNVYTGGLIGYAAGELSFQSAARNSGSISVAGTPNEAFTGGLVGYAANRVQLLGTASEAYGNSGAITVDGGTGVYTGGITANRVYVGALGAPSSNVISTGNITVSGTAKLYTGGFIGQAADGVDRSLSSASYGSAITVTALNPSVELPVLSGGIIGYASGVQVSDSEFGGTIKVTGGDALQTGGIAGAADSGSVFTNVYAGHTPEQYATIESDGIAGGIAGSWKGTMNGAEAEFLAITLTRDGGAAGGIAGKAQGSISDAKAGNAEYEDSDSVRIGMAAGVDSTVAGGIIGTNEGEFALVSGHSTNVALLNEAGGTDYKLGGVAGQLTSDAKVGLIEAPVVAEDITIEVRSGNSDIGGMIGQNHASELYVLAEGIQITVEGGSVNAGLIAGRNDGVISETASALTAREGSIAASGQAASLGGLIGENHGLVPASLTENVTITADGADSEAGGVAGFNTGKLTNNRVFELALTARGVNSSVGGVAGKSEPIGSNPAPVIANASVESELAVLLTVEAADVNAGGIVGNAQGTDILQSAVKAEDGFNVMIGLKEAGAAAGGIAGRAKDSKIVGDTVAVNVQNLLLTTSAAATDAEAGGIVGHGDGTRVDQAVGKGVNLLLSGSRATAGGMAGYNRGTDTATIANVYVSGLHIRANASADASTIGGFVGLNDERDGETDINPAEAVSTIQKSRYVGTGTGSSQAILIQAPNVIVGGMAGENRSLIANNSISDKVPVTVAGAGATLGGLVGVNAEDGVLYYTYSNANLNIQGAGALAGGLVGANSGQVLSSYVEADLAGHSNGAAGQAVPLGGLIGRNSGTVDKSYTSATVTANGSYTVAGGLIGEQAAGTVSNSYVVKNVAVTGANSYAGGFVGRILGGKISNVYSAANVAAADGSLAGGFAGRYDNTSKELLLKSFYVMDEENGINIDLSDFADGNHKWMNSTPRLNTVTLAGLKNRAEFPAQSGWDFEAVWKYASLQAEFQFPELIRSANSGGDGGSDVNANINWYMRDPYAVRYELHSESELAGLAAIVNGDVPGLDPFDFAGREIRIVNPIHIQSTQWVPIGMDESRPFEGIFNGGNYLIDGLTLIPDYDYSGLFGVIGEAGEARNMLLEPLSVAGKGHTGVLAGFNKGVLDNIVIHLMKGAEVSGGIAGSFLGGNTGTFTNVSVTLTNGSRVEAAYDSSIAGGLIGHNASAINPEMYEFQVESGSVGSSASGATIGGLIGLQSADATGLHADIESKYHIGAEGEGSIVGGLIGRFDSGVASELSVTFKDGILAVSGADSMLGGMIGYSDTGNAIHNVSVTADQAGEHLTGSGAVGGIVGYKKGSGSAAFDLVQAAVDKVVVRSFDNSNGAKVGGIAGELLDTAIQEISSKATISAAGGNVTAGGIVGHARNSILYNVTSVPAITLTTGDGAAAVGGVAGLSESDDRDRAYDFGLWAPLYHGIYDATVQGSPMKADGMNDNAADLFVGGITGRNLNASIYQSSADSNLTIAGAKIASAGGIAGYNNGIIVRSTAKGKIDANTSSIYRIGGAVGWSGGGEIHYTKLNAPAGSKINVGSAVTRPGVVPAVQVGGFIGKGDLTTITYSSTDIAVDVNSDNADSMLHVGGFAGLLGDDADSNYHIAHAFAKGNVKVSSLVGSSVGGFAGSVDQYRIEDAYASGSVSNTGTDIRTGGFTGISENKSVIENVLVVSPKIEAIGAAGAVRSYTGGLAGYNDGSISDSYAGTTAITTGPTGSNMHMGSLVGYQFRDGVLTDNQYAATLTAVGRNSGTAANNATALIADPLGAGNWDYEYDTYFLSSPNNGEVMIDTVKKLTGAILLYNNATGLDYYKLYNRAAADKLAMPKLLLGSDLDVSGMRITPFDHFNDVFDGQGHAIKGFAQTVEGDQPELAGFFARNDGEIANVSFLGFNVKGGTTAGLVTGMNGADGIIRNVDASGSLEGLNGIYGILGAIAGVNEGTIEHSYARGKVTELAEDKNISAGGIAGVNAAGGTITESFAFADVVVSGSEAKAGGIAGYNEGTIRDVYNSGFVRADGSDVAHAGGIVGYADAGIIDRTLNVGEVVAGYQGDIVTGQTFFGGIAGQKSATASITDSVYNRQMMKRNTAYYDAGGSRVKGASEDAEGLTASRLTNGTLPDQLSGSIWHAAAGFYPHLDEFSGNPAAKLSAAAFVLADADLINRIERSFSLTRSADVAWKAVSNGITISTGGGKTTGTVRANTAATLAVTVSGEQRNMTINSPAWTFTETALPPTVLSGEKSFTNEVTVELATDEPDGKIYYTTDGSRPTEDSPLYTAPIVLTTTTTLTAVTLVDTKEESELLTGTWRKGPAGGVGGGVFFPPMQPVEPEPSIIAEAGNQTADGTSQQPVKVAKNSKLTLTAPEGQVIYYTTDGSTPTKNSPQFKGELIITGNMTIKAITDTDDTVVTIVYEVEKAKYEVKDNAGEIKYISGYHDGTFRPDAAMTRMELVHALAPLLDKEDLKLGMLFGDVSTADSETVAFFASAGIIEGYPNGTFGGNKGLTRAEFTVIMSRVLNLNIKRTGKTVLTDISGHWAEKYVNAFTAAGYVQGFPDSTFRPESEISRAQAVVIINRIIGSLGLSGDAEFSDLPTTHWAYKEIMSAVQ